MLKAGDVVRAKAKLFRGLADVSRLSIVEVLRDGPKNVSQGPDAADGAVLQSAGRVSGLLLS